MRLGSPEVELGAVGLVMDRSDAERYDPARYGEVRNGRSPQGKLRYGLKFKLTLNRDYVIF